MGEVSISCPECGKGMAVNRGGAFCATTAASRSGAGSPERPSPTGSSALVEKGEVRVSGPRFRKRKTFSTVLVLEDGDVKFRFPKKN